ncbi:MAG: DUF2007 domain-containing protein [Myxococcota bacterium]
MICIYKARSATDAYLLQHWLQRNDIPATLRGDLLGLRGEIPIGDAWPTVWVAEVDRDRAEACIREFNGPQLVHPRWKCASCGEDNEPNFGSCWNCSSDRPGMG